MSLKHGGCTILPIKVQVDGADTVGGSSAWLSDIMRLKRSATGRSACPWEAGPYPFLATCRSSSPAGRLRPATVGEHSTPLTLGTCSTGLCFVMLLPVAVFSAVLSGLCWMAKMRFCPCGYRKVGCTVIWPCDQCTDLRGQVGVVRSGASGGSPRPICFYSSGKIPILWPLGLTMA